MQLLDKHGWPAVMFVAAGFAVYRVGVFFAPHISRICDAHTNLIDALQKAVGEMTEQEKRQTRILEEHTVILKIIQETTGGNITK